MSRADHQFKLRIPAHLRALVEQAAKTSRRSLNAELVIRLEQTFAERLSHDAQPLPTPAAPGQLHLLCVLVQNRDGAARLLPVHALRPMPPRVGVSGRFNRALVAQAGFYLRETHARRPAAKVVVRDSRLGQANALRADLRAVRAGGLINGR